MVGHCGRLLSLNRLRELDVPALNEPVNDYVNDNVNVNDNDDDILGIMRGHQWRGPHLLVLLCLVCLTSPILAGSQIDFHSIINLFPNFLACLNGVFALNKVRNGPKRANNR